MGFFVLCNLRIFFYCWVLGIFFLVDSLHCMVMFILNTRDGIYNRLLCKKKKKNCGNSKVFSVVVCSTSSEYKRNCLWWESFTQGSTLSFGPPFYWANGQSPREFFLQNPRPLLVGLDSSVNSRCWCRKCTFRYLTHLDLAINAGQESVIDLSRETLRLLSFEGRGLALSTPRWRSTINDLVCFARGQSSTHKWSQKRLPRTVPVQQWDTADQRTSHPSMPWLFRASLKRCRTRR